MRDVIVFETAQHMNDRVGFADIRKELVAETLAFRSALDQSGDVHDLDGSRDHLLRIIDLGEVDQPFVGTVITPTLGSIGTEREVRRCAFAFESELKSVDLPTLGSPTMPHCRAISLKIWLVFRATKIVFILERGRTTA